VQTNEAPDHEEAGGEHVVEPIRDEASEPLFPFFTLVRAEDAALDDAQGRFGELVLQQHSRSRLPAVDHRLGTLEHVRPIALEEHAAPVIAAAPRSSWHPAYFPIAAARASGSATLTHSREWSRNPMTLGILSTNAIHNPL